MILHRTLTPLALFLLAAPLHPQVKTVNLGAAPALTAQPMLQPRVALRANLLPAGKTQGTFHLTGIVRSDRTVVLRWANDQGEMPTEGIRVFRQKVGDTAWKDLTGSKPLGFLQGKAAEKRLKAMPAEERERLLAYPFGNVQHDPVTKLRMLSLPQPDGAKSRDMAPTRAKDLSPEASLKQFRELRSSGRINRTDLQLMHVRADMDLGMAEVLGLTYTDDPGRGRFSYKIVIALPEGGSVEVISPKVFNTQEPTPIPQPVSLSAASGNGEVLLNWDETPSDAVAGYNVYRAESAGGPWRRLNTDPVKKVELELEDPEVTLRRSIGIQASMERMLKPLPAAARTPQKVTEAHRQALDRIDQPGGLPVLSAGTSKSIKDAVSAGRLRPGGRQAPKAIFTDSRHTEGNLLVDEQTYQYKVTAVDLGGLEQPMDTAPVVAGIPKDLEPPLVPGRPMLKTEMSARMDLRTAQAARVKDTRLVASDQAVAAKRPQAAAPMTPFQLQATPAPTMASIAPSGLSLGEAKRMQLSRLAGTMPVSALKQLGEAAVLRSNADGTVPAANLAWSPATDADLRGYEVYRATGTGPFAKVADTTVAEWTDTSLEAGVAYRYAICSVDKLGNVSAKSPEGKLEVSDSSLPGRLAIGQLSGRVTKDAPTTIATRSFLRPADRMMATGSLRAAKASVQMSRATESTVTDFHATKTVAPLKAKPQFQVVPATKVALAKDVTAAPALDVSGLKASTFVKPAFRSIPRSFNAMLAPLVAPKQLHVLLEWTKPVQGLPLEYVLQQAPQRMEVVSSPRPTVAFQHGIQGFGPLRTPAAAGALAPMAAPAAPSARLHPAALASTQPAGLVLATPASHTMAAKGLVASHGAGLKLSELRRDHLTTLVLKDGPGAFTRVNETPITTERYLVTLPAEVAQYGGATLYFRIQTFTKEFGRTVEGPLSAPIEVRLPDIVAPPSPTVGAVDLQEGAGASLDVALSWTQAPARDLVGVLVDRQPMSYTLVDGEAKAGSAAGPAERLTPTPVSGLSYRDPKAPPGFQRYTLRAVDGTGNLSEALGVMDVLIPGEPIPEAPTQLALVGNRLGWKAAPGAAGYTVWRSFSGQEDDYACISGILPATESSFMLPAEGKLHLRVVARSSTGMNTTPSQALLRTP